MKKILIVAVLVLIGVAAFQRYGGDPEFLNSALRQFIPTQQRTSPTAAPFKVETKTDASITDHEQRVIAVIRNALPSVVTIGIKATTRTRDQFQIDPFNPFQPFRRVPGEERTIERNIGSGFILTEDGLIITNRHVVDVEGATYNVLTDDGKQYDVEKIYRDPLNDLAILKINANNLKPLPLGDSSKLQLGQYAIAIGTPLGEFRNTVTTGIISGLGRGITAGSPFEGYVEKLDNVIQTDAAISPGNSGGPLLNSSGQVIGVNTAVSSEGQNIGFAIPSAVVKELVDSFNQRGGSFERPYIGVRYKIIDRQTAVLNELVEGAYVIEVLPGSPADKAGLQEEDIIIQFDGKRLQGQDDQGLAKMVLQKSVGDVISLRVWRNGNTIDLNLTLEANK
ncbi:MAG: trypsin-like peptidase domain-containing protein [Patescibacteria group bacterium]|nr:trypsin-like peptidase domain-containing protein [Patescibacteria group bacterium]